MSLSSVISLLTLLFLRFDSLNNQLLPVSRVYDDIRYPCQHSMSALSVLPREVLAALWSTCVLFAHAGSDGLLMSS